MSQQFKIHFFNLKLSSCIRVSILLRRGRSLQVIFILNLSCMYKNYPHLISFQNKKRVRLKDQLNYFCNYEKIYKNMYHIIVTKIENSLLIEQYEDLNKCTDQNFFQQSIMLFMVFHQSYLGNTMIPSFY
jgi:hypothetical protein